MSKKEKKFEKELEKIARKSNFKIRQSNYEFENRIKKLDVEIDNACKNQLKDFDDIKKVTEDYLTIDHDTLVIDRYREKLRKI